MSEESLKSAKPSHITLELGKLGFDQFIPYTFGYTENRINDTSTHSLILTRRARDVSPQLSLNIIYPVGKTDIANIAIYSNPEDKNYHFSTGSPIDESKIVPMVKKYLSNKFNESYQ